MVITLKFRHTHVHPHILNTHRAVMSDTTRDSSRRCQATSHLPSPCKSRRWP